MKKARLLMLLPLLLVTPTTAQVEHAPTPAQCRADADVWDIPKASGLTPNDSQFRNLTRSVVHAAISAKKLDARMDELSMCMRTDASQSLRYEQGSRAYNVAEMARITSFVSRHNLLVQFYQEDDQGKR